MPQTKTGGATKERTIEIREITLKSPLEFRVEGDENPKMTGYAAVFDQWAEINTWWGDTFRECIKKGAFAKSIRESDVYAVWNHNPDIVLGSSRNGTLALLEDDYGLHIEIDPPKSPEGESKLESVRRGDVKKMSFAFEVIKEENAKKKGDDGKEYNERTILELKCWEVSPVVWPAYAGTTLGARSWLADNGIDMEALAQAMRTRKLCGEFAPEEIEYVKALIENLRTQLPAEVVSEPVEPLETKSSIEPIDHHSVLAALDVLEVEINLSI